jgi:hypothetical protein
MWANLLFVGGLIALLVTLLTLAYQACLVRDLPPQQATLEDGLELESLFPDTAKPLVRPAHQGMSQLTGFTLPIEPHGMMY